MSRSSDREYHEARAREEFQRAEEAADASIAAVHRELAALHRRRLMEIVYFHEPQVTPMAVEVRRPLRQNL